MKKENVKILGIESSCDETAVSIVEVNKSDRGKILSNIVLEVLFLNIKAIKIPEVGMFLK